MTTGQNPDNKSFFIRIGVIVVAVVLVMYLAKIWFIGQQPTNLSSQKPTIKEVKTTPAKTQRSTKTKVISWQNAADYYGEYATVEGTIVATYNSGKACFLNFHPNYKRYFTAVIFASAFSRFPANPENYYRGKKVHVSGYIKEYKGKPEIILNSPSQIEILE